MDIILTILLAVVAGLVISYLLFLAHKLTRDQHSRFTRPFIKRLARFTLICLVTGAAVWSFGFAYKIFGLDVLFVIISGLILSAAAYGVGSIIAHFISLKNIQELGRNYKKRKVLRPIIFNLMSLIGFLSLELLILMLLFGDNYVLNQYVLILSLFFIFYYYVLPAIFNFWWQLDHSDLTSEVEEKTARILFHD